jgi:peptidoglycan glycosyltransferase
MFGPAPQRRSAWPWLLRGAAAALALSVLLGLAAGGVAYRAYASLADALKGRLEGGIAHRADFQTTRIFDRNGTLLYELFGDGKRTPVKLADISPLLINATVAIEDKTFFQNKGVDYEGIAKALIRSFSAGEVTGGASTITQQLIKRVVLTDEERNETWQRKLKEAVLAQELTRRYSKNEILELYLNEIYYGSLAYGVEAASQVYFGKPAKDLNLAQAALLAGLPQLPNAYDPFNYLEGRTLPGVQLGDGWLAASYQLPSGTPPPKRRQIAVLTQMVEEGYVTDAQARAAAAEDLIFAPQETPLNAPHFVFYVRKLLEEKYGQGFVNRGLSVYTTIDLELQNMVQQKAAERIAELEERNIHNAAVVVMQPNTGEILAMVGSIDFNKSLPSKTPGERGNVLDGQVNVAVRERQPGSALKPFAYLAAMAQGMTPETVLWDVPTEFGRDGQVYAPLNYNGKWNGPLRMRTALANSLNMPAVKALRFAGVETMIDLLHRAGITGLQRGANFYGLSLTLGGGEVTPLDLTTAYNTLASGGRFYPPVAILKVVDGDGTVLETFRPSAGPQVLDPEHVAIISDILSDDTARAPIWGLNSKLKLSRSAAVKTGTSNDWRDAWAVGYTPYVTVGVWTGNNNNEPTAKVESITGGGTIWHNVMEALFANPRFAKLLAEPYGGSPPLQFTPPRELARRPICRMPGPFNAYGEELFTPAMLRRTGSISGTATMSGTTSLTAEDGAICTAYTKVTAVKLVEAPVADGPDVARQYCLPTPETPPYLPEAETQLYLWNLPPPDPAEKATYRWDGQGAILDGIPILPLRRDEIQPCTAEVLAVLAPPGSVRMPDLQGLGENQAKDLLRLMGVTNEIYVDYQGRDRIPEVYDRFPPYAVVSSLPRANEWLRPGETIVLGVRAPDPGPPPEAPPPAEPGHAPPAALPPTPAPGG